MPPTTPVGRHLTLSDGRVKSICFWKKIPAAQGGPRRPTCPNEFRKSIWWCLWQRNPRFESDCRVWANCLRCSNVNLARGDFGCAAGLRGIVASFEFGARGGGGKADGTGSVGAGNDAAAG